MSQERFNLILQSSRMVTPRVRQLGFVREDGEPLAYTPGQFITLHLPHADKVLRRSYSIATIPGTANEVQIAITRVEEGRATGMLFGMEPGAKVEATGPFGRFILRDDPPSRYILVATGTGVSPYRAMLPQLAERFSGRDYSGKLLLGVRSPEDLLYGEDFLTFSESAPEFEFIACYSRHESSSPQAHERTGYVQETLAGFELNSERDIVYLCGNPGMIDAAVKDLKSRGFKNPNLRREKYVSSN